MAYKPRRYHYSKTFFERLNGEEVKRHITEEPHVNDVVNSIKYNLNNILNTRIGQAKSAPDLGLEDFNDATLNRNEVFDVHVRKEIENCIVSYEPRVDCAEVIIESDPYYPARLNIRINLQVDIEGHQKIIAVDALYDNHRYKIL